MNNMRAIEAVQAVVAENCELKQDLKDMTERYQAVMMLLSPPALIPIADVPCRVVTGIEMESEPE